jgi:hypothetical protein
MKNHLAILLDALEILSPLFKHLQDVEQLIIEPPLLDFLRLVVIDHRQIQLVFIITKIHQLQGILHAVDLLLTLADQVIEAVAFFLQQVPLLMTPSNF